MGDKLWYAAGSDDFNAYLWEVPSVELLRERRREPGATAADWFDGEKANVGESPALFRFVTSPGSLALSSVGGSAVFELTSDFRTAFDTGTSANPSFTIPHSLSVPSSILSAHRSIVNTALFHPTLPLLFTAGIEKMVQVHSPTPFSSSASSTPFVPRTPRPRKGGLDTRDEDEEEALGMFEDKEALEYFDALLEDQDGREEALWRDGHGRGCLGDDSGEEEEMDEETRRTWEEAFGGMEEDDDEEGGREGGWGTEQDSDSGVDEVELEAILSARASRDPTTDSS